MAKAKQAMSLPCRVLRAELNTPGSIVCIGNTWYRITRNGNNVRATAQEVQDEINQRSISARLRENLEQDLPMPAKPLPKPEETAVA